MRVEVAAGDAVHHLDDVAVPDAVVGRGDDDVGAVGPLDDPPVVDVLVVVARHLLLVAAAALVGVLDRVLALVAVQPARHAVRVAQRHLPNKKN